MHALLWRHQVTDPVRRDEVVGRIRGGLLPLLASLAGVAHAWVVVPGTDEVMCIAFFASAEEARYGCATATAWIKQSIQPLLTGPIEIAVGEVLTVPLAAGS